MPVEELDDIFGEREILIRADGKIVTTPMGYYPDHYFLENNNNRLVFDILIDKGIVKRFKVVPSSVTK